MTGRYDNIQLKRVYDNAEKNDGIRLLADRLWPRGIKKTQLHYDRWIKDLCPSTQLRQSFHRGDINYAELSKLYIKELEQQPAELKVLAELALSQPLTLLSSVKHPEQSHLCVLKQQILLLQEELSFAPGHGSASPVCYQDKVGDDTKQH